jgi:hypothetical protein
MVMAAGVELNTLLAWGGVATAATGLAAALWRFLRGVMHTARRAEQFMDDWYGEPARPGVPERPSMMERVSGIEARLGRVEHELHPNDGASLRDAVDRTNRRLARLCPECDDPEHRPPPTPGAEGAAPPER